jgi:hypothetical protein
MCPGRAGKVGEYGVACNHTPCKRCQHYIDVKEKEYDRTHTVARNRKEKSKAKRKQAGRTQKA